MGNTLITPQIIAETALVSLYENLQVVPNIHLDLSEEFKAGYGDTINIRKPASFVAKDFTHEAGIEIQDATEGKIPLVIDKFKDVSFSLTAKEMRMSVKDLDEQLVTPAMQAVATAVEGSVIEAAQKGFKVAVGQDEGFEYTKPEVILDANRILQQNKVPFTDRYCFIGPAMASHWLNTPTVKNAEKSGSTEALRNASLGRLFNAETFQTAGIVFPTDPQSGQPTTETGFLMHKNALAFAAVDLGLPPGANGHVSNEQGLALRVTMDYDHAHKKTVCSVDIAYGVKVVDDKLGVLIKGKDKD